MHYFIGPFDYNPHVIFDAVKALFYACDDEEPPILLLHLIPPPLDSNSDSNWKSKPPSRLRINVGLLQLFFDRNPQCPKSIDDSFDSNCQLNSYPSAPISTLTLSATLTRAPTLIFFNTNSITMPTRTPLIPLLSLWQLYDSIFILDLFPFFVLTSISPLQYNSPATSASILLLLLRSNLGYCICQFLKLLHVTILK